METQRNIQELLGQIAQPAFLVREQTILSVNQAAAALLLSAGQAFGPLLQTGQEEYAAFQEGRLCLKLTIARQEHHAVVTRMEGGDLVVLDARETQEEFRAMSLVSLELRKPLMQAIASARQMEPGEDPKMNQSLMQMLRLVGNLSDISRYTASARMETRDVDSFLLELFEKAQTLAAGKAAIRFEGLKHPIFSQIDPEQLERAVWNILSNCLRFLPEGGTIQARLTRQGRQLRLTIEDDGPGVPEAVRSDLFRRYQRQPGIEDSRYGLGLGLAIVRAAAGNHGGTVLISHSRSGGTKVTMTLAIHQNSDTLLRSPLLRPDYAGGFDHALVELSDCLGPELYRTL